MTENIKNKKAIIKEWAKINLANKHLLSSVGVIHITMAGIKETLNQPHRHQEEKLDAIYKIETLLAEAEFVKKSEDKKERPLIWHYLKIIIAEKDSYLVIREDLQSGTKILYSIVDSIK